LFYLTCLLLWISPNMRKYYVSCVKVKKYLMAAFMKMNSSASAYFTLFESDFVNMTPDNYSWVETENSKVLLFIVAFGTVLIEHKIFDPDKETTKVAVSKLWLVYCVSSM